MKSATVLRSRYTARTIWNVLGFLVCFAILVLMVTKFFLIPGLEAAKHATHAQRRRMAAESLLLMSVLLVILVVGLLLTFRISRFFFPGPMHQRARTKVIDAWAEAGKRANPSTPDDPPSNELPPSSL